MIKNALEQWRYTYCCDEFRECYSIGWGCPGVLSNLSAQPGWSRPVALEEAWVGDMIVLEDQMMPLSPLSNEGRI